MKILKVSEKDFDIYNDWLEGIAEQEFIDGTYDAVECDGEIISCEIVRFESGKLGVCIGETIKCPS